MKSFLMCLIGFLTFTLINCAPAKENQTVTITSARKTKEIHTTPAPIVSVTPVSKEKDQKLKKLQGYDGFGYETEDSGENYDEEESGIEYVPVSLQHPLFKVFGINPEEYVVYYKYRRDQDRKFNPNIKYNEIDEIRKDSYVKIHPNKVKRAHRPTSKLELEEVNEFDYFDEEDTFELVPVPKKRSYPTNSYNSLYPAYYPVQQQQQPTSPQQYPQHFPYYPWPSCCPPFYPYPQPYPFPQYPTNPCPWTPPTYHQPCYRSFEEYPGTYKRLVANNVTGVRYGDVPTLGAQLVRRKRKNFEEILKDNENKQF